MSQDTHPLATMLQEWPEKKSSNITLSVLYSLMEQGQLANVREVFDGLDHAIAGGQAIDRLPEFEILGGGATSLIIKRKGEDIAETGVFKLTVKEPLGSHLNTEGPKRRTELPFVLQTLHPKIETPSIEYEAGERLYVEKIPYLERTAGTGDVGEDILAAMRAALSRSGFFPDIKIDDIGYGPTGKVVVLDSNKDLMTLSRYVQFKELPPEKQEESFCRIFDERLAELQEGSDLSHQHKGAENKTDHKTTL